jgi:RHS repeat-associated protein
MTPFSLFSDLSATSFQPQTIEFQYDELGRRISKDVYDGVDTSTSLVSSTIFFYDGWNLIAEVDDSGASEEVVRTYTWGLDLSGSDQGAGGVGGLLMVHEGSKTHFVAMDGNGNVSALTDGTTVTAEYEYGPFGKVLKVLGEIGNEMPFRFSTKFQDFETGLVYYGFRYYSPVLGRWVNRDPIEENGGVNVLSLQGNDLVNAVDVMGLYKLKKGFDLATDTNFTFGFKKVKSFNELIVDLIIEVGKYDSRGECGNCIELLRIAAHGSPGRITDNHGFEISDTGYHKYNKHLRDSNSALQDYPLGREIFNVYNGLKKISKLMCEDGVIEFISCESFAGESGRALFGNLEEVFGAGNVKGYCFVTGLTFTGKVQWKRIKPVPGNDNDIYKGTERTIE